MQSLGKDTQARPVANAERTGHESVCDHCVERAYVEVDLPCNINEVQKVVFTVVSCDQGFSDDSRRDPSLIGTQRSSQSWFEVAVVTPAGRDRGSRHQLFYNAHAVPQPRQHCLEWSHGSGSQVHREWLSSIRPGDRIQLIPKARHGAWRNNVFQAKIEVFGDHVAGTGHSNISMDALDTANCKSHARSTTYRSLEKLKTIRLLRITAGVPEDPIRCTLFHCSLEAASTQHYECLSYCWGDRRNCPLIQISDDPVGEMEPENSSFVDMPVTQNLYSALMRLRHPTNCRIMWIDALCINQEDSEELSLQVSIMREIYMKADKVVVWLGEHTDELDRAFADAYTVRERYQTRTNLSQDTKELHKPILDSGSYHVESAILKHEFFTRAWVIQEVYNAREVSVLFGGDVLPWSLILRINECIARSTAMSNPVAKVAMPPLFADLFTPNETLNDIKTAPYMSSYMVSPMKDGILDVILEGLDFETSDPRDKIFALLSFGAETADFSTHPAAIRPDYTKSTAQVFSDFTRWWISEHQSLRILSAVHVARGRTWMSLEQKTNFSHDSSVEGRPSWSLWHTGKSIWVEGTLGLNNPFGYRASGDRKPILRPALEENGSSATSVLSLMGRVIGSIDSISRYPYYAVFQHLSNQHEDQTGACSQGGDCPYTALHIAYTHLMDPLTWAGTWTARPQGRAIRAGRQPEAADVVKTKAMDHLLAHARVRASSSADGDSEAEVIDLAYGDNASVGCHQACWFTATIEAASLTATDTDAVQPQKNRGLCPPAARTGDLIVVLDGGNVPYILRPRENSMKIKAEPKRDATSEYQENSKGRSDISDNAGRQIEAGDEGSQQYEFLGECYIDDFMHGQADTAQLGSRQFFDLI